MLERRFRVNMGLRADSQGDELSMRRVSGYAARFNVLSSDIGGFREKILPGAFRDCLREGQDIKCLRDHDPSQLLGRVRNKSLDVVEDARGLRFSCQLPNTTCGRDTYQLVRDGTLGDCSFAFTIGEDSWDTEEDPDSPGSLCQVRTLRRIKSTYDISLVTSPAYPQTSVEIDSLIPMYASSPRMLWPQGVPENFPSEVRSRILMPSRSVTSRHRVIDFILS